MNILERKHLLADLDERNRLIDQMPESDVIDRMSLEARKEEVGAALSAGPVPTREPVRARLTFRGAPIIGSHGMFAEFGAKAINALRGFLKTLSDQEAICALEFNGEVFRFADIGQVRRSEARLNQDNIHEEDKQLSGHFLGVLPNRRTFEFLVADTQEIIAGNVGADIEDAAIVNHVLESLLTI